MSACNPPCSDAYICDQGRCVHLDEYEGQRQIAEVVHRSAGAHFGVTIDNSLFFLRGPDNATVDSRVADLTFGGRVAGVLNLRGGNVDLRTSVGLLYKPFIGRAIDVDLIVQLASRFALSLGGCADFGSDNKIYGLKVSPARIRLGPDRNYELALVGGVQTHFIWPGIYDWNTGLGYGSYYWSVGGGLEFTVLFF